VARRDREAPGTAEPVARLADRADDVPRRGGCGAAATCDDPHPGVVHRRAYEVVHRRIDDAEVALAALLQVEHLAEEKPGVADQRPPPLDDDLLAAMAARIDVGEESLDQRAGVGGRLVAVGDAEAAADV